MSNRYAAFGTKTHEYREKWLRDGVPPDASTPEGRCAIAGLELLPMPGTCMVEIPIRFELEGVAYVGFADVVAYQAQLDASGAPDVRPWPRRRAPRVGAARAVLVRAFASRSASGSTRS